MYCNKCYVPPMKIGVDSDGREILRPARQGRVFVDRIFSERKHVELFCINCGYRWMLDKTKNVFAAWIVKVETVHAHAVTVGPSS